MAAAGTYFIAVGNRLPTIRAYFFHYSLLSFRNRKTSYNTVRIPPCLHRYAQNRPGYGKLHFLIETDGLLPRQDHFFKGTNTVGSSAGETTHSSESLLLRKDETLRLPSETRSRTMVSFGSDVLVNVTE